MDPSCGATRPRLCQPFGMNNRPNRFAGVIETIALLLLQFRQLDVLELNDHRRTLVNLECQHTFCGRFAFLIVNDFRHQLAINHVTEFVAVSDQLVMIPVFALDGFTQFLPSPMDSSFFAPALSMVTR